MVFGKLLNNVKVHPEDECQMDIRQQFYNSSQFGRPKMHNCCVNQVNNMERNAIPKCQDHITRLLQMS